MPSTIIGEKVYSVRGVEGIDRQENQRLEEANALFTAQNLYARVPDILADRPGTRTVINGRVALPAGGTSSPTRVFVPSTDSTIANAHLGFGESLTPVTPSYLQGAYNSLDRSVLGVRGQRPIALGGSLLSVKQIPNSVVAGPPLPVLMMPASRTAGLARIYLDQGIKRYWVGAYNFGGDIHDRMFFIRSDYSGAQLVKDSPNIISSHGADFYFTPFRFRDATASATQSYFALATNQVNQPITIKDGSLFGGDAIEIASLAACKETSWNGLALGTEPANTVERLTHVQSMCVYVGSIVYGGFHTIKPSDGTDVNYENYLAFSATLYPHKVVENSGILSTVRIGDTEAEPITAVATSTTTSDSAGVKGQLIAWTGRKVVVFDGLPPQSGKPLGADFSSIMSQMVGCNAPRTVVNTPLGVIFLGSDGYVYLIPAFTKSGPLRIGHSVWDIFRGMSPRAQKQCAAFWHPLGYYCLSYPETQVLAPLPGVPSTQMVNPLNTGIPNRQLWCDMRQFNPSAKRDLGAKWFGPHTGMIHSCFAIAGGYEDNQEIFAGSAIDGSIIQCWQEDLAWDPDPMDVHTQWTTLTAYTAGATIRPKSYPNDQQRWECKVAGTTAAGEPAWPTTPAPGTLQTDGSVTWVYRGKSAVMPIATLQATGVMDGGDIHIDKEIDWVAQGVSVDRPTTVTTKIITLGSIAGNQNDDSTTFTDPVSPPAGSLLGSSFILGTSKLTPPNRVVSLFNRLYGRLVGRAWRAEIRGTASAGAKSAYSDLAFGVKVSNRRP